MQRPGGRGSIWRKRKEAEGRRKGQAGLNPRETCGPEREHQTVHRLDASGCRVQWEREGRWDPRGGSAPGGEWPRVGGPRRNLVTATEF